VEAWAGGARNSGKDTLSRDIIPKDSATTTNKYRFNKLPTKPSTDKLKIYFSAQKWFISTMNRDSSQIHILRSYISYFARSVLNVWREVLVLSETCTQFSRTIPHKKLFNWKP